MPTANEKQEHTKKKTGAYILLLPFTEYYTYAICKTSQRAGTLLNQLFSQRLAYRVWYVRACACA